MIVCQNVGKIYKTPGGEVTALQGISFTARKGEFIAVMGPSGSGKTTLLHILGGLEPATSGEVIVDGKNLRSLTGEELTVFRRRHIGYIFQSYNLIPGLTAAQNVALPAYLDGRKPSEAAVLEALDKVGLRHRARHKPSQLSGGEQQRIAFARAIFNRPSVILGDEPTASLDAANAADVLDILRREADAGTTVIMVTHDHKAAARADRIIELRDGRIADEMVIPAQPRPHDARMRLQMLLGGEAHE